MDELIERITSAVGIEADVAQQAVGHMLGFLKDEAPDDKIGAMLGALPGAEDLISNVAETSSGGGGGLMGMVGGLMGGQTGDIMALGSKLMDLGIDMDGVGGIAKETLSFAQEKAGGDVVDAVTDAVPALKQFI